MMESFQGSGSTSPVRTVLRRRPDRIPGLSSLALSELSTKSSHCRNLFSPGPSTVLSPVTRLALDMNNLAGLGRFVFWFSPVEGGWHAERVAEVVKCALACTQSLFASLVCPHSQYDTPKRRKLSPLEKVPSFASDVSSDAGEFYMNIYIFSVNSSSLNWCC